MTLSYQRRCLVLLTAAVVALGVHFALVGTGAEREIFAAMARTVANPPVFTEGDGSDGKPFGFRSRAPFAEIQRAKAPVVVSIGDDPDGVFQESPPSPTDVAVVLKNLRKLGAENVAVAAVLSWKEPDLTSFKALEIVMARFGMVVHAAPLTRHTLREPMPEAFERASLKPDAVAGDLSRVPIINRVAVADVVFAPGKGLAGFSTLDNLDLKGRVPLLARWEEDPDKRVVLAFPLLAVLARYELPVGGVRVRLGEAITLGSGGPVVPIDDAGCLALPPKLVPSRADVSAEAMIGAEDGIFPEDPGLIVLRDDQSFAPAATRRFSRDLSSVMAAIASDGGLAALTAYPRVSGAAVLALGVFLLAGMWLACGFGEFGRNVCFALMLGYVVVAQFSSFGWAGLWYPGTGAASGLLAGWGIGLMLGRGKPTAAAAISAASPPPETVAGPAHRRASIRSVTIWREPAAAAAGPTVTAGEAPEPGVVTEPVEEPAAPPVAGVSPPGKRAVAKTARSRRKADTAPPEESAPGATPATRQPAKRAVAKKAAPAEAGESVPPPARKTTRRRKSAPGTDPETPPAA